MLRISKIFAHEKLYHLTEKYFYLLLLIPTPFIVHLLSGPGILMFGDFPVIETSLYSNKFFYTWIDYGSYYGFETLSRYPFLALGYVLQNINIGPDIISKSLIGLGFFSALFSFYFACILFFRNTITRQILTLRMGSLIGSLFYAFNVWSFHRMHHWYLWLGYAILPLFFILVIYSLRNPKNWKYPIAAVITWSIASSTPHMVIFYGLFYLALSIYFLIRNFKKVDHGFILIRPILLIISLYLVLNLYWIYPYVLYMSHSENISIIPSILVSKERTEFYSQHSNYLNVLRLIQDWWEVNMADVSPDETSSLYPVWILSSFVFPILALSSLLLKRNVKKIWMLSAIGLIGILLAMGTNGPFNFYTIFLFDSHLPPILQYLFRDPDKWSFLIAFAFSFLLSISTSEILKKVNKLKHAKIINSCILTLILTALIIYVYPIYNSTSKILSPITLPSDFEKLGAQLKTLNTEKVFYILQDYVPTEWNKGRDVNFLLYQQSSTKPSIGSYPISSQNYVNHLIDSIISNNTNNIKNFIYPLGTSYVIFNNDTIYPTHSKILRELSLLQEFKNTGEIGLFNIFKAGDIDNDNFYLHIPKQKIIAVGGLDLFSSLNYLPSFSTTDSSLYFLDQNLNKNEKNASMGLADYLALSKNIDDFILSFMDEKFIIAPFDNTDHREPSMTWSKAGSMDPLHGDFHPVLKSLGINNWDFDYGKGLVITDAIGANLSIPIEIQTLDKDVKNEGTFDLFMRYFKNQKGGYLNIYLDDKLIDTINTMDRSSNNFLWKKVGSINLTSGKHTLTLQNIGGFNSVNIFAIVPDEEIKLLRTQTANLISNKTQVIHLLEAEESFYNNKGKETRLSNYLLDESNNFSSDGHNQNNTTRSLKGQFKIPANADLVALEFFASGNNKANSYYSIKDIKINSIDDYSDVFTSDFESEERSPSAYSNINQLNFINQNKDLLSASIQTNRPIDGNGSLKVDVEQGNFSYWGVISTDYIPIDYNIYYNLSLDVSAKDVKGLHSKVFYYDENKKEINVDFVFEGRDGTFEQGYEKILSIPLGAKYIKLQMWVSPNSKTPSSYLLDNVVLRKAFNLGVVFEDKFTSIQNINSKDRDISIAMNDKNTTNNVSTKREAQNLDSMLSKWNSSNITKLVTKAFHVSPNSVYDYTITVEIKNMNFLYGVASFRNSGDVVENSYIYGDNASNGNVLSLSPESEIISTLNIVKPSNYMIALNTKTCDSCTFLKITLERDDDSVDDYTSVTGFVPIKNKTSALRWSYSDNIYLKQGTYHLKIYSDSQTELDSVVVYSTDKTNNMSNVLRHDPMLEDLFNPNVIPTPAYISEYKKIDPTKFIIYINNATQPYTISFAEAYDPLWIAHANNGDVSESNPDNNDFKSNSIPLYSVVNGFHVNKTGNYSLIIEYQPQLWFIQAGTVSLVTLILLPVIFLIKYHRSLRFKNRLRFHQ